MKKMEPISAPHNPSPALSQPSLFPLDVTAATAKLQGKVLVHNSSKQIFDVLESKALSYADITYADGQRWQDNEANTFIDPLSICPKVLENPVPLISCFTGGGGFDLGAHTAGFETVVAVDIDKHSCTTLRENSVARVVLGPPNGTGNLHQISSADIKKAAKLRTPFNGLLAGGPPCQPFSIAANQRFSKGGENFKRIGFKDQKRGTLLNRFMGLILNLRPTAFLLENVRGLLEVDGGKQLSSFRETLAAAGYTTTDPMILNTADFGVPQIRQRLFVVGNRLKKPFTLASTGIAERKAVLEALSHIPDNAPNHLTRNHAVASILRYRELSYGQREKLGRVDRLHPFKPSKTVIAGGSSGGGRSHLHPFIPRTLSVRECARLQTFPDSYVFHGPSSRQFTQVGNAIPPLMGYRISAAIAKAFF